MHDDTHGPDPAQAAGFAAQAAGFGVPRGVIAPSPGNYGGLAPGDEDYEKVKELVDGGKLDEQDGVSSFRKKSWSAQSES
jgi:hypothetical protein